MDYKHVVIILVIVLVVLLLQYNQRVTQHEREIKNITMRKFHEFIEDSKEIEQSVVHRVRQSIC